MWENLRFIVRAWFGNIADVFFGVLWMIWDNISREVSEKYNNICLEIHEIKDEFMLDEWNAALIKVIKFITSPSAIYRAITKFSPGEYLMLFLGWGIIFGSGMMSFINWIYGINSIAHPEIGPSMILTAIAGIIICSGAFVMQSERREKRRKENKKKAMQATVEFLVKYPEEETVILDYGSNDVHELEDCLC